MALDAYANCLCGSGKKFKWCCSPFFDTVEKAFKQEQNKQHVVAVRMLEQLCQQHDKSPAVWCYLADLLMMQGKFDEAEKAIEEALQRDAKFAKALMLKASLLHEKDQFEQALHIYRQAADACDPDARELMADIHVGIAQLETIRNHPFAAKAAIDVAHRCEPSNQQTQEFINRYYGLESQYPAIVRKNHVFKKMIKKEALPLDVQQATQGGKLSKLHQLMEGLVQQLSYDPAFFYNLGLTRAWVGENRAALEAFEEYVRQAPSDQEAAEAWTLAEAIRMEGGDDVESDNRLSLAAYRIHDSLGFFEKLRGDNRLVSVSQKDLTVQFSLMDRDLPPVTENLALYDLPRVICRAFVDMGTSSLLIYSNDSETLAKARQQIEQVYGASINFEKSFEKPGSFVHLIHRAMDVRLPEGLETQKADHFVRESLRGYFEDRWSHQPLHSLQGNTPLDAVGHPILRRKLLGCIALLEQVMQTISVKVPYTMDELRHKLGLDQVVATEATDAPASVTARNAEQLSQLNIVTASDEELKQAFVSAKRLDANELATRFAQALIQRAGNQPGIDSWVYDQHIVFQLLGEDRIERAYVTVLKAMERDAKLQGGKRSIDYRKLRLKVLLAGKRLHEAKVDIDKLILENSDNLDLYVFVIEELLRFGHKELACKYATQAKAQAEKKGDRDRLSFFDSFLKRYS